MADKLFLTPVEISKSLVGVGEKKAKLPVMKMFLLGILAGVYIGFAAHLATTVSTGGDPFGKDFFGLQKFLVGAVFTVGLMLVVIPGSELWTGNNLMAVALFDKKITVGELCKNWFFVYVGNFVGSILLALIIANSGLSATAVVGKTACNIAAGKCSLDFMSALCRGIGCNWLVCLAVLMAIAAQDITGKLFGMFFPIMAFVASGFEHSIANMYFISAGLFNKANVVAALGSLPTPAEVPAAWAKLTWDNFIIGNLLPVTIGNFIGGFIFVGMYYWYVYVREEKQA
jgi:formate transporter